MCAQFKRENPVTYNITILRVKSNTIVVRLGEDKYNVKRAKDEKNLWIYSLNSPIFIMTEHSAESDPELEKPTRFPSLRSTDAAWFQITVVISRDEFSSNSFTDASRMVGHGTGGWAAYPNRFQPYIPNPHATAAAIRAQAAGGTGNGTGSTTPPGGLNMVKVW